MFSKKPVEGGGRRSIVPWLVSLITIAEAVPHRPAVCDERHDPGAGRWYRPRGRGVRRRKAGRSRSR